MSTKSSASMIGSVDLMRDVLVIAEIGNNHEGNFDAAVKLVAAAAQAGVQAVKFQTIVPEKLVRPGEMARLEQLRRFQFSYDQFERLSRVAADHGVMFLSTPFDLESASFLGDLCPALKVASGDSTFYPLIERIADLRKPILLSSGATTLEEMRQTQLRIDVRWQTGEFEGPLVMLHCVSSYPTPDSEANLRAISTIAGSLGCIPGYSDHTLGTTAALLAVALGARVIEKHFTLDRNYSSFRDHQLSADPQEMATLVSQIRAANHMLGDGQKAPRPCEAAVGPAIRRSIAASRDLVAGQTLTPSDLTWLRPADGLPPGQEGQLVGRVLRQAVRRGESLRNEHVE